MLLLSFLFLVSCNSSKGIEDPLKVKVNEATYLLGEEKLVLPLDYESGVDSYIRGYVDFDRYFFYNKSNKSIYTYLLRDSLFELEYITQVPLSLDSHLQRVAEVYYHNTDSIFVFDDRNLYGDRPDLFLINVNGEILNSYKLSNVTNGDVMKLDRLYTITGPTVYYHKGKIYMATSLSDQTTKENLKPLLIYDLVTGEKTLRGEFPLLPTTPIFGQFTYSFQFVFVPDREELYFSWAYESDLYRYSLVKDTWEKFRFSADEFSRPDEMTKRDNLRSYTESNSWFYGVFYDYKTKRLHRQLLSSLTEFSPTMSSSNLVQGLVLTPDEQRMVVYSIDIETGNYDVVHGFSHFRTILFHPRLGPLMQTQLNESYNLDVEDYLILAPIVIQ